MFKVTFLVDEDDLGELDEGVEVKTAIKEEIADVLSFGVIDLKVEEVID